MARVVLGLGTSHGPMLSTPWEQWTERVKFDRGSRLHYKGGVYGFDELVALRAGSGFEREITTDAWRRRHAACQLALRRLAEIYADVRPDVAVIVGNDQKEVFVDTVIPALTVFWGDSVENIPSDADKAARLPPGVLIAERGHCPPERTRYATEPDLGRHLIEHLVGAGYDVAQSRELPRGELGSNSVPHAFGFVYRRVMRDAVPPHVPVMLNTFYPPNQPRAARCFSLGPHLLAAIASWKCDARVALVASGGLSHFVIDEDVDRTFLAGLRARDFGPMIALGEEIYQSGTSEIKNWMPVAGAMAELGFPMELVGYEPCYRSAAGTGNAVAFAAWRPAA